MKKSKFLVALACFGLLVTGCNKPAASSKATPASSSGAASTPASTPASIPASSNTPTSSVAPVEDKYYSQPFGYDEATKWEKGHEYKWTFALTKNYKKVTFAFGAQMSSSSHGGRSLYTNHEGASSDDKFESNEANDGTCRIVLKVNGVQQEITHDTYEEAGLTNTEINYFRVAEFAVNAGNVEVSMTTHAQTGYRLMLGGEARLYYKDSDESATPITPAFEGYNVNFVTEHCKVYVYEGKKYSATPTETNTTKAMDEDGNIIAYDANADVQPQVNFKVVCDEGYSVNATNISINPNDGFKNLKQNPAKNEDPAVDDDTIFRITKVQKDLTVTITPVQGEQAKGHKITFVPTHCQVKVYVGPKNADGTNLDTPEEGVYYARLKDAPYDIGFTTPQVNFEVVCEEGYEFIPTITEDKVDFVSFTAAEGIVGYNKFKANEDGTFNMTKIDTDLTITIAATAVAQPAQPKVVDFSLKTASHSAYNDVWEYGDVTVAGGANNNGGWAFVKMGGKAATISAADHPGTYIKTNAALDFSVGTVTIKYVGKCYNQDSEKATVKVEAYSDAALTTKVGETDAKEVPAITTNEGIEEVTYTFATAPAANMYYKVHFDIINTTTYNGVVALEKITFNPAQDAPAANEALPWYTEGKDNQAIHFEGAGIWTWVNYGTMGYADFNAFNAAKANIVAAYASEPAATVNEVVVSDDIAASKVCRVYIVLSAAYNTGVLTLKIPGADGKTYEGTLEFAAGVLSKINGQAAPHDHAWVEGTVAQNTDGKNVTPLSCSCGKVGAKMAMADYSSAEIDTGLKFKKNSNNTWKIIAPKAGKYEIRVSAKIDAVNVSHNLSESPVTCKVGETDVAVSTGTFSELGVGTSNVAEFVLVPEATFAQGENVFTLSQGSGGYRLTYGGNLVIVEL